MAGLELPEEFLSREWTEKDAGSSGTGTKNPSIKMIFGKSSGRIVSIAQQFHFTGKAVHSFSDFSRKVDGGPDTGSYGFPPCAGNQVIRMRDDLLFSACRYAVPGRQSQECAFIGREARARMALNDPGEFFGETPAPQEICSFLGMMYRVGIAPADIVEHRTCQYQIQIDIRIFYGIFQCAIRYRPAVGDNLLTASGIPQYLLVMLLFPVRHDQGIF
jgi:hypothetical protein